MKAEQQEGCGLKTYKIGEIAKMLGISAETIRNYEKKGLICPYKEESNYRYFDIIQINHLLNLQKYQKYDIRCMKFVKSWKRIACWKWSCLSRIKSRT